VKEVRVQGSGFSSGQQPGPNLVPACLVLFLLAAARVFAADATSSPYPARLAALAAKCDELGLKQQAEITRDWMVLRYPGRQYLFLPAVSDPAAPKAGASETIKQWYRRFQELRRERAAELFNEAKAASDAKNPARAWQLLYEVLREDPDHAHARRVLGYVKTGSGQWTPPEAEKTTARAVNFNHPKLGWPAGSYWNVETPHFAILTNHSKREGLEAGEQLENLHALWRQVFFRYWSSPEALAARFAGGNEPLARPRPRMNVALFKDRPQYAAYVAAAHPKAATTLGIYIDKLKTTYLYGGDTSVYPIWYHEAAHQLFLEGVAETIAEPGESRNFWAIEGAALYMESLADHGGYWTVGGCEANRLQFARYRVLSGDLNLPLARLTAMSRADVQNSDDIGRLYTQAAGYSHFLLDGASDKGAGGKYREAFVDLISAIYRGTDTAETLAKATGQALAALDEQYRHFLIVTDDDLASIPDVSRLRNLSLCRGQISDEGLKHLAGCKTIEWLDLSLTPATDAGLAHFAAAAGLKQLFLEGSKVTAASLPLIGRFKQLEQLDLSGLPITDASLSAIAALRNLKQLYLTGCPITDAALPHLRGQKQLEQLETSQTQITPEALAKLRAAMPRLKY